jgi:hypothetical protein
VHSTYSWNVVIDTLRAQWNGFTVLDMQVTEIEQRLASR